MDDLAAFLRARLGEDEAAAKAVYGFWRAHEDTNAGDEFLIRFGPARVLREVEAVRAIITNLPAHSKQRRDLRDHVYLPENADYHTGHADGTDDATYYVLRQFAAVYCDHPGYRQEWRT